MYKFQFPKIDLMIGFVVQGHICIQYFVDVVVLLVYYIHNNKLI